MLFAFRRRRLALAPLAILSLFILHYLRQSPIPQEEFPNIPSLEAGKLWKWNGSIQSSMTSDWPKISKTNHPVSTVFPRHPGESGPIHIELMNLNLDPNGQYFGAWQFIDNQMENDNYENGQVIKSELALCNCKELLQIRLDPIARSSSSLSFMSEAALFPRAGRFRFCLIRGHLQLKTELHDSEESLVVTIEEISSHAHVVHHRSRGIHAVFSYYVSQNPKRHEELLHTLRLNLKVASALERVYLLRSEVTDAVPMEFLNHPKVRVYDTYATGRPEKLFEDRYLLNTPEPTNRTTYEQLHHFMIYALDGYRTMCIEPFSISE